MEKIHGIAIESGQRHGMMTSAGAGEMTVWSTFPGGTAYIGPGPATSMVNYRVKNLDAMLAQLRAAGGRTKARRQDKNRERKGAPRP